MEQATRTTFVDVDGVRSRVVEVGAAADDAAVVLVHGNPGEASDWLPLMAALGDGVRCVAPDMPGYGQADKPADFDYTTDGYARHLGSLLEEVGVSRAHLVLHDLGGPWGMAWAAANQQALASLTLVAIGALPGYRWHRFARMYRRPILGELLLMLANRRAVLSALRAGSKHDVPDEFVDKVTRGYRDSGTRRAILRYYRATDLADVTVRAAEALRAGDLPTLVVWGAGDPYVPVTYANEQTRFFPRAKVVVLPDSGHWPFVDDPAAFAAAVVDFLREQVEAG